MIRIFLIFISLTSVFYASPCTDIKCYIEQNLQASGTLEQAENGFVYVKVGDDYIYELHKFIQNSGFNLPPYFGEALVGAHITVIKAEEAPQQKIEELGQLVTFKIEDCQVVHPQNWQSIEAVYILTVDAPMLDFIRDKYGLGAAHYPFHITIGVLNKVS